MPVRRVFPVVCEWCKYEHTSKPLAERHARYVLTRNNGGVAPIPTHNASTYINWGCHCPECTASNTANVGRRARARKEATQQQEVTSA